MSRLGSLAKLDQEMPLYHKSTFDFGSCEITENEKQKVINAEAVIAKRFKDYSEATFDICKNLYEVSLVLKAEGKFMEWCDHVELTKDKVSELLKRYELYMEFYDGKDWVSSLSGQAVKFLTHKDVSKELLYRIYDGGLKTASDIKQYIEYSIASDQKLLGSSPNRNDFLSGEVTEIDKSDKDVETINEVIEHIEVIGKPEAESDHFVNISKMVDEAEIIKTSSTEKNDVSASKDNPQKLEIENISAKFLEVKSEIKNIKLSSVETIKKYRTQIRSLIKELQDLDEIIQEQEEKEIPKNNMPLFREKVI